MLVRCLAVLVASTAVSFAAAAQPADAALPSHQAAAPHRTATPHFTMRGAAEAALRVTGAHKTTATPAGRAAVATSRLTASSAAVASVVTGPQRSTWDVTYTGFTTAAKAAFQAAVNRWSTIVSSPVPIKVTASFEPMQANQLGYAGPTSMVAGQGLGDGHSFYPMALANALWGSDIDDTIADIDAHFSSTATGVYYGTDGNVPTDGIDFVAVVMHELGHGLGFVGSAGTTSVQGVTNGSLDSSSPIYDAFTADSLGTSLRSYLSPSVPLLTTLQSGVYWNGNVTKGLNGGTRPKLFSPNPWQSGSSYSHLDETLYPQGNVNALMTPVLNRHEVIRTPGPLAVGMLEDEGWTAALPGPPAAPSGVSAVDLEGGARVSWQPATDNGADVDRYTVTASPGGAQVTVAGTGTSATFSGLMDGTSYTFTVTAHNVFGDGTPSAASAPVTPQADVLAPSALFASGPLDGAWSSGKPSFGFAATDPGRPGAVFTYTCQVDGGSASACPASTTLSLSTGAHTLTVVAFDEALNPSAPITRTWNVDATAPSAATVTGAAYSLGTSLPFTLKATDSGGSGLAGYSVRWARATWNGGFGAASASTSTTAGSYTIAKASKGYTYCVYVRARDAVGNLSATEVSRCTATALDDRSLTASSGWTRGSSSSYYAGTFTSARKSAISVTRSSVQARRLAVVATTCPTCGSVDVLWNGVLIKTLSLTSTTTKLKQILVVKDFGAVKAGTVVLKTRSTRSVYVDGLGVSRV